MTRVKICGITNVEDARTAIAAGADALGFVFAESPRQIAADVARLIIQELPPFAIAVGVFRDQTFDAVQKVIRSSGINVVQLHGDESPAYCERLHKTTIKRLDVRGEDTASTLRDRAARFRVAAVLLDPGAGSGRSFHWEQALGIRAPVIVAGGLHPDNVAMAMRLARPYGVDVASGVEDAPGRKNASKVRAFIDAVRREDALHAPR